MPIPFLDPPEPGESARGYVVRVAEANGVTSNLMCDWLELPKGSRSLSGETPTACELLRIEQDAFYQMGFDEGSATWIHGHLLPVAFLLDYRPRVCAACLDEQPYHRRIWDLRHVEVCPRHKLPLTLRCPAPECNARLHWSRPSMTSCHCGQPLTDSSTPVPDQECELESLIYARIGVAGHTFRLPEFNDVPLHELFEVLLFLGRMERMAASAQPNRLSRRRLFTDRQVMVRGLQIVKGWPASFNEIASNLRASRGKRAGLSGQYGPLHRFVERLGDAAYGPSLRKAYSDHLAQRGDINPAAFPSFLGHPGHYRMSYVSRKELFDRLGLSERGFERLRKGAWFDTLKPVATAGVGRPLYDRADVERFVERMGSLISFREADRRLGVPIDSTRALIEAGLVSSPPRLTKSKLDGSALDPHTVEALLSRIDMVATRPPPAQPVAFMAVVNGAVRKGAGRLPDVVRGVLEGVLACYMADPGQRGFAGLTFERADVDVFMSALARETRSGTLSLIEADKTLVVRHGTTARLVRDGVLPAVGRNSGGTFLHADVIEQFAKDFVSLTHLGILLGDDARAILGKLEKKNIRPAFEVAAGTRVSRLYRRAEVDCHIIAGRL